MPDEDRIKLVQSQLLCTRDKAIAYLELRDQGYTKLQALLATGLTDPDFEKDCM